MHSLFVFSSSSSFSIHKEEKRLNDHNSTLSSRLFIPLTAHHFPCPCHFFLQLPLNFYTKPAGSGHTKWEPGFKPTTVSLV